MTLKAKNVGALQRRRMPTCYCRNSVTHSPPPCSCWRARRATRSASCWASWPTFSSRCCWLACSTRRASWPLPCGAAAYCRWRSAQATRRCCRSLTGNWATISRRVALSCHRALRSSLHCRTALRLLLLLRRRRRRRRRHLLSRSR